MDVKKLIEEKISEILKHVGVDAAAEVSDRDDGAFDVNIDGSNLNFLIGYRGESLEGLQAILKLMLYKDLGRFLDVDVDISGYRKRRREKIEEMTKRYIDRVRLMQKDVEMPAMAAFERKFVHVFVSEYTDVVSESVGDEPVRRVVLKPAAV